MTCARPAAHPAWALGGLALVTLLGAAPGCGEPAPTELPPAPRSAPEHPLQDPPAADPTAPDEPEVPIPPDPEALSLAGFVSAISDDAVERREHAIYRLGVDFDAEALNAARGTLIPLLTTTLGDVSGEVRRGALMSLTRLGAHEAPVLKLVTSLLQDPEVGVRAQAADLLGSATKAGPARDPAITALWRAVGDPVAVVRHNALQALIALAADTPEGEATLQSILASDADDEVRVQAALAYGELGYRSPGASKALLAALAHAHSEIRAAAAWSLGTLRLNPAQAVPLLEALEKSDGALDVRRAVTQALAAYASRR